MVGGRGVNPQEATIPEEQEDDGDSSQETPSGTNNKENNTRVPPSRRKKGRARPNKQSRAMASTIPTTSSSAGATSSKKKQKRRKKRNRLAYVATVQDDSTNDAVTEPPSIPLPLTHYQTALTRRAIRKEESLSSSSRSSPKTANSEELDDDEEVYGDISLGMKLQLVGVKVIVQHLIPLSDGRASPAQLVGVIQRGDVLLAIENMSLVNLPFNMLMERLQPLSTPDSTGEYKRMVHLRLAAGEGMEALRKYEAAEARKTYATEHNVGGAELFSLFPMVDHMSTLSAATVGMPPLHDHSGKSSQAPPLPLAKALPYRPSPQIQEEKKQTEEPSLSSQLQPSKPLSTPTKGEPMDMDLEQKKEGDSQQPVQAVNQLEKSMDDIISDQVAQWRSSERKNFTSEFFAWNDNFSELLRPQTKGGQQDSVPVEAPATAATGTATEQSMTKSEMLELGRKAIVGADSLYRRMEEMDRGKDMRSFRSWNSSISLRSRASTRRKYILDAVSLPVTLNNMKSNNSRRTVGSIVSEGSEASEMDDVDGDALLLGLAAHDEIWRNQVLECLEGARERLENGESDASDDEEQQEEQAVPNSGSMDDAITKELGTFLFGETMAKIITKKKKSKALPPAEITAVLFDLSTNLASTMPDEVAIGDGTALKSTLVPFLGRTRPEAGSSVILATRFVLDEALTIWLETFRPLPWGSRRVLWPYVKKSPTAGEALSPSMLSDMDSLSDASPKSAFTGSTGGNRTRTGDLRQQIEDQELDVETRAETCFLVTYYFTQRLLPKVAANRADGGDVDTSELIEFVDTYGAYLRLHTCLAYAAALEFPSVISKLLKLAEHDLRHMEIIKLFMRRNALILYEPTMLSAVVQCLPRIREEPSAERRQVLVDICVSAYPDLCPWQVKQALLEHGDSKGTSKVSESDMNDLHYYYLSNLLHPHDGHDGARQDPSLVQEWCELSLDESSSNSKADTKSRRQNFLSVASRNSSDHLGYKRDLVMLIELSMKSHEHELALDLAGEIVERPTLCTDNSVLALVLRFLREITESALDKADQSMLFTLKRATRLLHQMSKTTEGKKVQAVSVPDELHRMLEYKEKECKASTTEVLDLIQFFSNEALPSEFLEAFAEWCRTRELRFDTLAVLQSVLRRGTRSALNSELSGSLLRLRRARRKMETVKNVSCSNRIDMYETNTLMSEPTIWNLMSKGLVAIDK